MAQTNLLFAIAHCDDKAALEAVAEKIRRQIIPQQNAFHHSHTHFSLGVAALGLGEPLKALIVQGGKTMTEAALQAKSVSLDRCVRAPVAGSSAGHTGSMRTGDGDWCGLITKYI